MTISLFDRIENTVGKGENAGYQHFLLFPQCFLKPYSLGSSKAWIVWLRAKSLDNKVFISLLDTICRFTKTSSNFLTYTEFNVNDMLLT